jgi:transcriptional regulator with XRE-family HTH domain
VTDEQGFKGLWRYEKAALVIEAIPTVFAQHARQRREALGLSQAEVVSKLFLLFGIEWHQTALAKVEARQREVKLQEAYALASLYGIELDDLVLGRGLNEPRND